MVARVQIAQPESIIRLGEFKGDLEENLRRYSPNFEKECLNPGSSYRLFERQDPSLVCVFSSPSLSNPSGTALVLEGEKHTDIILLGSTSQYKRVGIAVVSYDPEKNHQILAELARNAKIRLVDCANDGLSGGIGRELSRIYEKIFSDRVIS